MKARRATRCSPQRKKVLELEEPVCQRLGLREAAGKRSVSLGVKESGDGGAQVWVWEGTTQPTESGESADLCAHVQGALRASRPEKPPASENVT